MKNWHGWRRRKPSRRVLWLPLFVGYFTVSQGILRKYGGKKKIFQLKTVYGNTQESPTLMQAYWRSMGYLMSSWTYMVGFILPLFRKDNLALHDLLCGSHVVQSQGSRKRRTECATARVSPACSCSSDENSPHARRPRFGSNRYRPVIPCVNFTWVLMAFAHNSSRNDNFDTSRPATYFLTFVGHSHIDAHLLSCIFTRSTYYVGMPRSSRP